MISNFLYWIRLLLTKESGRIPVNSITLVWGFELIMIWLANLETNCTFKFLEGNHAMFEYAATASWRSVKIRSLHRGCSKSPSDASVAVWPQPLLQCTAQAAEPRLCSKTSWMQLSCRHRSGTTSEIIGWRGAARDMVGPGIHTPSCERSSFLWVYPEVLHCHLLFLALSAKFPVTSTPAEAHTGIIQSRWSRNHQWCTVV